MVVHIIEDDEAVADALTIALEVRTKAKVEPGEQGEARCLLARALPKGEITRARGLAEAALKDFERAGDNWLPQKEACQAWLGDHPAE